MPSKSEKTSSTSYEEFPHRHLALYEVETEDLEKVVLALSEARASGVMRISSASDRRAPLPGTSRRSRSGPPSTVSIEPPEDRLAGSVAVRPPAAPAQCTRAVELVQTSLKIHSYVCSRPLCRLMDGAQPRRSPIRVLSLFRPRTP
jgi:hypothetical protein